MEIYNNHPNYMSRLHAAQTLSHHGVLSYRDLLEEVANQVHLWKKGEEVNNSYVVGLWELCWEHERKSLYQIRPCLYGGVSYDLSSKVVVLGILMIKLLGETRDDEVHIENIGRNINFAFYEKYPELSELQGKEYCNWYEEKTSGISFAMKKFFNSI
eukprot:TRINITY_DN2231_c0_g1_i2.p2 TRINITY_DN2231_c0_g1~~TRINITY_DN2231_c0_g1_i2.p2  ORF type:complete len:157 (+),score=32.53 TRINITY_DN2231_c0_g1_i2:910-1380(+)